MVRVGGSVTTVGDRVELQERIDDLDSLLSTTVKYPEWFADHITARMWIEEQIMQLEAEQLVLEQKVQEEKEKSRLAGRLVENSKNIICPMVPQWSNEGNRGN